MADVEAKSAHERGAELTSQLLGFLREKGAQKSEIKVALGNLGLIYNLRLVPIGTAVGGAGPGATARGPVKGVGEKTPARPQQAPAAWKQDPRWLAACARRSRAVAQVKVSSNEETISELRSAEAELKSLKTELRK
jgi:hypothetical protein